MPLQTQAKSVEVNTSTLFDTSFKYERIHRKQCNLYLLRCTRNTDTVEKKLSDRFFAEKTFVKQNMMLRVCAEILSQKFRFEGKVDWSWRQDGGGEVWGVGWSLRCH